MAVPGLQETIGIDRAMHKVRRLQGVRGQEDQLGRALRCTSGQYRARDWLAKKAKTAASRRKPRKSHPSSTAHDQERVLNAVAISGKP